MEIIKKDGSASIEKLSKLLSASPATIRRDLAVLERTALIRRAHGGAMSPLRATFEPSFSEKEHSFEGEKQQIAAIAAAFVNDGDTVILDGGTTTLEIARELKNRKITVVTNSVSIGLELAQASDIELYSTGGRIRGNTLSMVGSTAESFIRDIKADIAFIAVNGFTQNGATTPHMSEASIKKVMIASAREVMLVADHSKFGKEYFAKIAPVSAFNKIITDSEGARLATLFKKCRIEIVCE